METNYEKNGKKNVLLAEDNPGIRGLVERIFKIKEFNNNQYNLKIVGNGKEALDEIERDVPYMLISDIEMPIMNGLELLEKVNSNEKCKCLKIGIMSSNLDMYVNDLSKYNNIKTLKKPFAVDGFIKFVKD